MPAIIAPTTDLGEPLGGPDRRFSVVHIRFPSGHYRRSGRWSSFPDALVPPAALEADVGGASLRLEGHPHLAVNAVANWDDTCYVSAAQRAGKDFYVYAHASRGRPDRLVLSNNSTLPTGDGYTAENTRKLGGFHCLCASVGVVPDHPLSGMTAGQILPASVWDLRHRPLANPEGMVYHAQTGKWFQIYLANVDGGSVFGATIADGDSGAPLFGYAVGSRHWFNELLARGGMTLPSDHEFQLVSRGSNQGTNISSFSDPVVTGGHMDNYGRRMISDIGLEDCCGAIWQWLLDLSWVRHDSLPGSDIWSETGGNGRVLGHNFGVAAGGNWADLTSCGSASRVIGLDQGLGGDCFGARGCSLSLSGF